MKNEVADQHPTSMESLKTATKIVWIQKMTSEYCRNLIESMPRRMVAVVKNKGGLTKYENNKVHIFLHLRCIICLID